MSLIPKASVAVRRSAVMTDCEKYGGTASSSAAIWAALRREPGVVKRSGSENAGHSCARPQPRCAE
jgi:hypothetical protein